MLYSTIVVDLSLSKGDCYHIALVSTAEAHMLKYFGRAKHVFVIMFFPSRFVRVAAVLVISHHVMMLEWNRCVVQVRLRCAVPE